MILARIEICHMVEGRQLQGGVKWSVDCLSCQFRF